MGFHGCVLQSQIDNAKYVLVGVKLTATELWNDESWMVYHHTHMDEFGGMTV